MIFLYYASLCQLMFHFNFCHSRKDADVTKPVYISAYDKTPVPSDVESESDLSESEPESGATVWRWTQKRTQENYDQEESKGWLSWCVIV